MKKIAIAAAVASTLLSAAHAQTSVTLYGVVDLGYENIKSGEQKADRLSSGMISGSRWGLRGTEDLGDGLKVNFRLESGFAADRGTSSQGSRLFGRQAWVGLQSDSAGELRLGRQISPIGEVADNVAAMGTSLYSVLSVVTDHSEIQYPLNGEYDLDPGIGITKLPKHPGYYRLDNAFTYISPRMSGFQAQLTYSTRANGDEELADGVRANGRNTGLRLDYSNGPLYIGLGHNAQKIYQSVTPATAGDLDHRSTLLGGRYDFGPVKLYASYTWDKLDGEYTVYDIDKKSNSYIVGVLVPAGNGEFNLEAGRRKVKDEEGLKTTAYNIGYKYFLSKRTTAYFQYLHVDNDEAAMASLNSVTPKKEGDSVRGLAIGLRHSF